MQKTLRVYLTVIGAAVGLSASLLLAACGGHNAIPPAPANSTVMALSHDGGAGSLTQLMSSSCYSGDTKSAYTTSATVTFYGWPDNSPPGAAIAHPVIHSVAGGDGSYCNPTTFATEPTSSENSKFPYGTRIYVPLVKKYFIREDDCTNSGPSVGSGSNGCSGVWFDLWLGGDNSSNTNSVVNCENTLTPSGKVSVIINPPSTESVSWTGPIYSDSKGCNKGGTTPTPTPKPTSTPTPTHTATPSPKPSSTPSGGKSESATVTFYGWPDNSPPGCAIANPVIHSCAGGNGTYSNPTTFATETANNTSIPYGTKIYVPLVKKYFIREDDCAGCTGTWVDLWIGGDSKSNSNSVINCENSLTPNGKVTIILNPPSNEPVSYSGSIWSDSTGCNKG